MADPMTDPTIDPLAQLEQELAASRIKKKQQAAEISSQSEMGPLQNALVALGSAWSAGLQGKDGGDVYRQNVALRNQGVQNRLKALDTEPELKSLIDLAKVRSAQNFQKEILPMKSEYELSKAATVAGINERMQTNLKLLGGDIEAAKVKTMQDFQAEQKEKDRQNAIALQSMKGSASAGAKASKPPSSDQFKAATFARRLEEAEKQFADLQDRGFDPTSFANAAERAIVPDAALSDELKQQRQAERNFLTAQLRRESGAAISPSEFKTGEAQYFPRAGDSDERLVQKARNRQILFNGLKAEAGNAFGQVAQPTIQGAPRQQKTAPAAKPDVSKMSRAEKVKFVRGF